MKLGQFIDKFGVDGLDNCQSIDLWVRCKEDEFSAGKIVKIDRDYHVLSIAKGDAFEFEAWREFTGYNGNTLINCYMCENGGLEILVKEAKK